MAKKADVIAIPMPGASLSCLIMGLRGLTDPWSQDEEEPEWAYGCWIRGSAVLIVVGGGLGSG
jgi:hypothetical protein